MSELPQCPRCGELLAGAVTPKGAAAGRRPYPEGSTGYCMHCHVGVTKTNGLWGSKLLDKALKSS